MPAPKKKTAVPAHRTSAAAGARDAIIAEHMARAHLALRQQAELMTQLILAVRGLTEQTAALSAQVATLKRNKRGAPRSR